MEKLVGYLQGIKTLTGNLTVEGGSLTGTLSGTIIGDVIGPYEGEYTITPKAWEPEVLHTNGLKMLGDVVIQKIPYWETSNLSDGYTVYIAEA